MKAKLSTRQWTHHVTKALEAQGQGKGYEVISNRTLNSNYLPKTRPDIVWRKGSKQYIFEIDQLANKNYHKTIYGSMFTGVILAKEFKARFIQVVPNDKSHATKARETLEAFKKLFRFNNADVLVVPRKKGKNAYKKIGGTVHLGLVKLGVVRK